MAYLRMVDDLATEFDTLERRYGPIDVSEQVNQIHTAQRRHQFALDLINQELDQLMERRRVALDSIESLARLEREILKRAIAEERRKRREAWSPTPILGFRAWLTDGRYLRGAFAQWTRPTAEATCLTVSEVDEVPHTDGRCGVPPCGIYALKEARRLAQVTGWAPASMALGLVALTGKVVEHELGYRAQKAEILALAIRYDSGRLQVTGAENIQAALDGTWQGLPASGGDRDHYTTMCLWLEAQKEMHQAWTSENKTA